MKRYITIFGFFALFLMGSQFVSAQEQIKKSPRVAPEVTAKQKTYELHQLVDLTGEQQGQVFKLLVDAEQNLEAINVQGGDATTIQSTKNEVLNYVNQKLSVILTPEQYKTYQQSLQQESANKSASIKKKD